MAPRETLQRRVHILFSKTGQPFYTSALTCNQKVAYYGGMVTPFHALADPTRREILERLRKSGPLSVSDVTEGLPMTRQAVTKHLNALAAAGLIRVHRVGRERLHELDAEPLRELHDWLAPYEAEWDRRLERLKKHLEEES